MVISFNGAAGSGKSTIAKLIAERLGWPYYNMGGIRRRKAEERGLTLAEYNKLGETDSSTDIDLDNYLKKLAETDDNFIIDSRTAWHFIPASLKIYLDTDERIGAQRIYGQLQEQNGRNEDRDLNSLEDVKKSQRQRIESDNLRYKKYYDIDVYDKNNYDFVLDTSNLETSQVFQKVLEYIMKMIPMNND